FFQAEDGIRYFHVTGVQTCALPIYKDGDAGVLGEDYDRFRALRPRVEAAGFYWTESLERPGGNPFRGGNRVKIRRSQVNHTNVDIFPWYRVTPQNRQSFPWVTRTDDGMRHRKGYIGADRYKGREFPEAKLLPPTMMKWEGMELPAPADPLWSVEHRYGPNWRTPIARNNDGLRRRTAWARNRRSRSRGPASAAMTTASGPRSGGQRREPLRSSGAGPARRCWTSAMSRSTRPSSRRAA